MTRGPFEVVGRIGGAVSVRCLTCGREQLLTRSWFARINRDARHCRYCRDHRDSNGLTPRHLKIIAALAAGRRVRVVCTAPALSRLTSEPLKGVHQTLRILARKGLVIRSQGAEALTTVGVEFAQSFLEDK